ASAKKLFATTHSASDLSAVAGDLGVQVVITGKVKHTDEGWQLSVSVRHGPTGHSVVKLKYPLRGPRLDKETLQQLADEVVPSLDTAAAGPTGNGPEAPEAAETPAPPTGSAAASPNGQDVENPLNIHPEAPPSGLLPARPEWTPWFDASLGFALAGRTFAFDNPSQPQFHSSVAAGLRLDATVFPLAAVAQRPGAGTNAITGLGIGFTLDAIFWPDSVPTTCAASMMDMAGNCTDHYGTHDLSYQLGLRWRWNVLNRSPKTWAPELLVELQFGERRFTIDKTPQLDAAGMPLKDAMGNPKVQDVGPPDVDYKYITVGVGTRILFLERWAAFLQLNLHGVIDAGPIQTASEYGPGSAVGVRIGGGVEARIWKGLFARLALHYEHFGLSFASSHNGDVTNAGAPVVNSTTKIPENNLVPPCPCSTTGGASDAYWGAVLSVGYAY
ncbi:MAG TPA: hypothetical protein VE987_20120, partial [Polyangiaceae bacterium]|nr:hypothetical protein [Polyangiaceae bacterium]